MKKTTMKMKMKKRHGAVASGSTSNHSGYCCWSFHHLHGLVGSSLLEVEVAGPEGQICCHNSSENDLEPALTEAVFRTQR